MGLKCLFKGHIWEKGICKNCNLKVEDYICKNKDLEMRECIISKLPDDTLVNLVKNINNNGIDNNNNSMTIYGINLLQFIFKRRGIIERAMKINNLPQEALVYIIKNSDTFSIIDMAIKKIKDDEVAVDLALSLDNRDIKYSILIDLVDEKLIEKFINDKDPIVNDMANKMYNIVKMTYSEILDYKRNNLIIHDGTIKNLIDKLIK
jgi:hypothetical protein